MFRKLITTAAILSLTLASAEAALLTGVEGPVSVSHGNGFKPANGASQLAPGDRVRTGDGTATIVYDNGCVVKVGPHQVVAVLYTPPACNGAGGLKDGAVVDNGISTELVVGGLVVAGAIGGAIALSNNPVSP